MADQTTEIGAPGSEVTEPLFCQFPNRLAVTGVVIDCLRQLFKPGGNNLVHPKLKDYFWAENPTQVAEQSPNQIIIEDSYNFNLADAGVRPCIRVKAEQWAEGKLVIGDNGMGGDAYYKRIQGSHSVIVVGKTIAQAELLAREVHGYLSHFGPILREWMNLLRWDAPTLGAPERSDEHSENIIIPITVSYEIAYSWELTNPASRLLRQIVVNAIIKED